MIFLVKKDLEDKISSQILSQITEDTDEILDTAEIFAIGYIKDILFDRYDIDTELSKTDTDRHINLVRWLSSIASYHLWGRVLDSEIPERIIKDYDDTRRELEAIASGKRSTTLIQNVKEDNSLKTVFRWGSQKLRYND